MNNHELDFVQLTYNIIDNEDSNYLQLTQGKIIAVIANRPFQGGKLFNIVNDKKIPTYAIDIGIRNWARYF